MKRLSGTQAQLQWWIGLGAMLCVAWIAYSFLIKATSLPDPALPRGACPGEEKVYESHDVNVVFRADGCERVSTGLAVRAGEVYHQMDPALQAFRLPPLPRNLRVGIYAKGTPGYELLGRPGGPRAIVVRAPEREDESALDPIIRRAYAELALQEAAPGLDAKDRRALAGALAYLTYEGDVAPRDRLRLNRAEARALEELVARGPFHLAERLLERCRPDCRW